jgi:hypothetical protein
MAYRLMTEFANLFSGQAYLHRHSTQGDFVAAQLYEDLFALRRSDRLVQEIVDGRRVVNNENRRRGVKARRGDGTFGEIVPGYLPLRVPDFAVGRGQVATIEIGVEVKILAKAMLKQIDRVMNDLQNQARHFRRKGTPICVAVVGINTAQVTTGYEGDRWYVTDGKSHKHPFQEAAEAERRLREEVEPLFDEFVVLRYRATNATPFGFKWADSRGAELDYGAALARVTRLWEQRFV